MRIAECIRQDDVELDLTAPTKTHLLQILSEKAAHAVGIDERTILAALQNREKLGSTGIGAGIAIPHAPVKGLAAPFGLFARLGKPVDFESIDGVPVDIVCLVLTPADGGAAYLPVLSRIARLLRSPEMLARIRSAATAAELHAAITAAE